MKLVVTMAALVALGGGLVMAEQAGGRSNEPRTVSDAVRGQWNTIKRNIKQSAEQMPEENFRFKPTPEVRSFGEILAHVAGASYMYCSAARAEKSPYQEDSFVTTATTKAQIVKATNDAIAYCDEGFAKLTDANAGEMVANPFGQGQMMRVGALIATIAHDNEHYGNLVTYFRLKGMVPPSSQR